VLVTLGFRFDWMSGGKKVALRVEAPMVNAKVGEAMIWHWSVSQWQQMRRKGDDWHILLDFVGPEIIDEVIAICGDPDAEVRFLGATMLRHVGYYGLNIAKRLAAALATLDKLAVDRSKKVSAIAIEARDHLVERGEYEGVRAKFPWILNYDEKFLKRALTLLGENRPIVHRYIYGWIKRGTWNNKALPKFAVAKLRQLAKNNPRVRALLDEL
jgi:hypothetical protein